MAILIAITLEGLYKSGKDAGLTDKSLDELLPGKVAGTILSQIDYNKSFA